MSTTQFCAETLSGVADDLAFLENYFMLADKAYENDMYAALPSLKRMCSRMWRQLHDARVLLDPELEPDRRRQLLIEMQMEA